MGWFRGWSWRRKSEFIVPGGSSEYGHICVGSQATSYPRNKPLRKHNRFGHPQSLYFQGKSHTTFILFVEVRRTPIVKVGCCRVGRLVQSHPEMETWRKCDGPLGVQELRWLECGFSRSAGRVVCEAPAPELPGDHRTFSAFPSQGEVGRACQHDNNRLWRWGSVVLRRPRTRVNRVVQ